MSIAEDLVRGPTLSPFLPNTNIQYAWDSTSLGWMKTCPRLYYYQMIEGWSSDVESVHLRFGIEYHQALQEYDICRASGIPHNDAVHDTLRALLERTVEWQPDHKYKNRNNLVRTVLWYLDRFENDPASTLILKDGKPAVEVSFRFELGWGPKSQEISYATLVANGNTPSVDDLPQPYLLSGHLDRIVNFQDELFVMDRKTTTSTPGDYYFNQFEPNNQMTLYTLAGKVVLDSPIRGVIIDAAQVAIDFSRFTRGITYRTQDNLEEWLKDLRFWFAKAEDYATEGYWPMNDTACDKFGGCRFREVCSKSPSVRKQFLKSGFTQQSPEERWNPLKSR